MILAQAASHCVRTGLALLRKSWATKLPNPLRGAFVLGRWQGIQDHSRTAADFGLFTAPGARGKTPSYR